MNGEKLYVNYAHMCVLFVRWKIFLANIIKNLINNYFKSFAI